MLSRLALSMRLETMMQRRGVQPRSVCRQTRLSWARLALKTRPARSNQHMLRLSVAGLVLALCACGTDDLSFGRCGPTTGTVTRIVDGDTIEILFGSEVYKVRYLNVDAPEMSGSESGGPECLAEDAKLLNEQLTFERTVELEYDTECTDRFDRLLAFVKVDGRMVNEVIVERGFGQVLVIPPNVKYQSEFEMLEARAKENRAGIWGACQ